MLFIILWEVFPSHGAITLTFKTDLWRTEKKRFVPLGLIKCFISNLLVYKRDDVVVCESLTEE